jgi:hypothetical protein
LKVGSVAKRCKVSESVLEVLGELQQLAGFRVAHPFDHMLQ